MRHRGASVTGRRQVVNRYRYRFLNTVVSPRYGGRACHDRGRGRSRGRLGGNSLEGHQRSLRGRRADVGARPGRDRAARLHVEPRRAEPAQSPLERDRRHHRGHRALQRRAAQGRRTGDPRHRLRPRRLLRLRSPRGPGRLGAALARAGQRPHRRLDPGHAQQRRRDTCRAARRRRPQRALLDAPDGGLRQPQGRGRGDRAPDRARPPAYRLPRGTPRPRVRAAPRAGLPRRAGGGRHPVRPRPWSASAATGPTPRPRPPATSWGAKDGRRRSSLRTTRRRSRR